MDDKIVHLPFQEPDEEPDAPTLEEAVSEYVRDALPGRDKRSLRKHLKTDPQARQLADQLEATWDLLDAWPDQSPPPDAFERFSAELERLVEREKFLATPQVLKNRRWSPLRPILIPLGWAAAVALVVITTFYSIDPSLSPGKSGSQDLASAQDTTTMPTTASDEKVVINVPEEETIAPPRWDRDELRMNRYARENSAVSGLLAAGHPRANSVFQAVEAGVMVDRLDTLTALESDDDSQETMASLAKDLENYVPPIPLAVPEPPDAPEPARSGTSEL